VYSWSTTLTPICGYGRLLIPGTVPGTAVYTRYCTVLGIIVVVQSTSKTLSNADGHCIIVFHPIVIVCGCCCSCCSCQLLCLCHQSSSCHCHCCWSIFVVVLCCHHCCFIFVVIFVVFTVLLRLLFLIILLVIIIVVVGGIADTQTG